MNITRNNYEEFFILYLDNELSREDRSRVELFAQQHPDLGEELNMLLQTRLAPDAGIVFKGKQSLMKSSTGCDIGLDNYEEWLVLYVDNELTIEQEVAVENFAIMHPAVKAELDILQKTKLQPEENIIFFNKESLYRKEEPQRKVIAIRWWRMAVAAVLLFAVSITGFFLLTNKKTINQSIAGNSKTNQPPVVKKDTPVPVPNQANPVLTTNQSPVEKNNTKEQAATKEKESRRKALHEELVRAIPEETSIASVSMEEKNKNNLPDPTRNPNINGPLKPSVDLTKFNAVDANSLVTNNDHPSFKFTGNSLQPDETEEPEIEPGKKTKFRGLLRKITRTFEKTTNIKATDDQDRLLVGGLAIRL